MKKSLLLIPLFLFSLMASGATVSINNSTADALRLALNSANDGDIIEMAAGTYEESNSNYIAFNAKSVTVKAADGATVIIKPHVPFIVSGGARAEIKGIKIDASELCSLDSYSHLMYPSDDADNNRLILDGCEVYGYTVGKAIIASRGSNKLDYLTINNCKFYNHTTRSCVYLENTENKGLTITNSTFYNIATGTESFSAGIIDDRSSTATVRVDHCTFYNVVAQNTEFAAVGKINITDGIVSNSIFMLPTNVDGERAIRGLAQANNCLTYNYIKESNWGIHSSSTKTNCINGKDPLFANAASGDFTLANNWVTMNISPAIGAGTDGSDLGDPRWHTAGTLPSTNFASAYDLLGTKAMLTGNIELNASDHIRYKGSQVAGSAKWKLHISKACAISAVADREAESTSGCTLTLTVYDADGNEIDATTAARSDNDNDINIGNLYIPEEGDYTIVLSNSVEYSGAILEKITLTYVGGAVQTIASATNTTVDVSEAWYSAGGSRADGKISFPGDLIATSWIRWNVHVAETKYYDITVNFASDNGHNLGVRLFNDARSIALSEGGQTSAASPQELGRVSIPAGDYTMEVTNPVSHSHAQLISVLFAPVAASATELPNTLDFSNAVLSDRAHVTEGNLYFAPIGDTNPAGEWASWAVTTDHDGTFLFSMGVNSTNGQSYRISIYDDTDNLIDSFEKKVSSNTAATIKHYFNLAAGNYFVKVENTTAWSHGYLTSLVVTEPSFLTLNDTDESNTTITANYRDGAHDILITRTIAAGMYNTICLPFDVGADQLKEVFGNNVDLRAMSAATIEGEVISLNFDAATSIYRGTPYLIKTASDIVNPIFVDVEIKADEGDVTGGEGFAADFIGTFIKQSIAANENNLFLGANDKLYFSTEAVTIKGFRAYFAVNPAAGAPTRARIVMREDVVTEVELVEGALPEAFGNIHKFIENGQLIIVKDGAQYNAFGVRVK